MKGKYYKSYYFVDWYIRKSGIKRNAVARTLMNFILTEWEHKAKNNRIRLGTKFVSVALGIDGRIIDETLSSLVELSFISIISKPHTARYITVNEFLLDEIAEQYENYISDEWEDFNS